MKKSVLAAVVVVAASSPAWAVDVLLDNGGFDPPTQASAGGFTQTITNWQVSFSGSQPAAFNGPAPQTLWYSGVFSSFAKYPFAPSSPQFVLLNNQGAGTVTMTSQAVGGPAFRVNDRNLSFRYAFLTQDAPGAATHDQFRVVVNFFSDAAGLTALPGTLDILVADRGLNTDSAAGIADSPFGHPTNGALATYNNTPGTDFALVNIDISQFFNSFARVSFIVNNVGPTGGTDGNGLGVSGIVLDSVLLNPEPSTLALFAAGMAGLGGLAWRRRRAAKKPA